MPYSTVFDKPLKTARRSEVPTLDGESMIQELGFSETKVYRFHWITTDELQAKIQELEAEAADGWVIVGEVGRTPIHEALDLYNAQVTMRRLTST
jgi:hypothetical protein